MRSKLRLDSFTSEDLSGGQVKAIDASRLFPGFSQLGTSWRFDVLSLGLAPDIDPIRSAPLLLRSILSVSIIFAGFAPTLYLSVMDSHRMVS